MLHIREVIIENIYFVWAPLVTQIIHETWVQQLLIFQWFERQLNLELIVNMGYISTPFQTGMQQRDLEIKAGLRRLSLHNAPPIALSQ